MRPSELDRLLGAVLTPRPRDRGSPRRALEEELRARHGRLYPRKRWTMLKSASWFRPAVAMVAVLVLGIAACNAPTRYDVEMGQRLTISLDSTAKSDGDFATLEQELQAITTFVDGYPGVERVAVNITEEVDGPTVLALMAWGQELDPDTLLAALLEQFPVLADATIAVEPLTGTLEGNLGDALGHALFDLHVDGATAEEVRAQILQQLAEQGFTGDASVQVHIDEAAGVQTIDVELTEPGAGEAAGSATEDQIRIERKSD